MGIFLVENKNFSLAQTLDCGQAFRWREDENGAWCGIVGKSRVRLYEADGAVFIEGADEKSVNCFWHSYFDLDRDYGALIKKCAADPILMRAAEYGSGIRILKQEPWEALCSFIISQNNNIPRIKGIIDRLCTVFGEDIGGGFYSFPTAERLALLEAEDLSDIRAGFRAKYIIDAARRVSSGEIDLEALKAQDADTARQTLMKIKGVGPKVADCALLYGLGHIEAFPKDVWIKRATNELFGGTFPQCALDFAGIAQQYIFYYIRGL